MALIGLTISQLSLSLLVLVAGVRTFKNFTGGGIFYPIAKWFMHRYMIRGQIEIACGSVGAGVSIVHPTGAIIINGGSRIGHNCRLSPGVVVGISSLHRRVECPVIGDNVYLAPNAKVYGRSRIGNNCIIGTDTIVRDTDVPDNCVAVGSPLRIIEQKCNDSGTRFSWCEITQTTP